MSIVFLNPQAFSSNQFRLRQFCCRSALLFVTFLFVTLLSLTIAGCVRPALPQPPSTKNSTTQSTTDEASERLQVPAGFHVRIFASDLNTPRMMTVGPDGALYVTERDGGDVTRLFDGDGDGLADENMRVAEGLDEPHGVEWRENSLYVAATGTLYRMTDSNGDMDFLDEGEQVELAAEIPSGGGHSSRSIHFGPDGMIYVSAGSDDNIGIPDDPRRGSIMRFTPEGEIPADNPFANDPDPQRRSVWAEGLRNSVDFLFLPDGRLWADHNGMDSLGDEIPPEEIVIEVEKGKHYGWPYCYTPVVGVVPPGTQEVRDDRVDFEADSPIQDCAEAVPAFFTDLAHQAPLGMVQYNHTAFPAEYQGNLFVAYHGSWNSSEARPCQVQMIVVREGLPVEGVPFLTGFQESADQECGRAWGRPAGVAVGLGGELFVSDDENGRVYRVVFGGE